jgi:hypothetical protein
MSDKKIEKKPGFWSRCGNAVLETIGLFLYQGPK